MREERDGGREEGMLRKKEWEGGERGRITTHLG
jgi:hypothetical protein